MPRRERTIRELETEVAALRRQLRAVEAERDKSVKGRDRDAYLQVLLDLLPEVAFISDLQWRLVAVNDTFLQIHGLDREAVIGKSLRDLGVIDPAVFDTKGPADVAKMLAGGCVRNVERRVIAKDGVPCDMLISMSLLPHEDGQPREMLLVARNITEIKTAVAAKEDCQRCYRLLFETEPNAVVVVDFHTGIVQEANQRACDLLERPREQVVGMHFSQLHPQEERARLIPVFESMTSGFRGPMGDCHILTATGKHVPIEIVAGLFERDGRSCALGIFRDVTEHHRAVETIRRSEDRYRDLVERMVEIIFSLDLDTRVVSANSAVTRTLGYAPEGLTGQRFIDLVSPEHRETVAALFERVVRGQNVRSETVLLDSDGQAIHVEFSITPVTKDGHVVGLQAVLWDISRRKMLECKLRESEERYRTLVESAGEAIATVDHDGVFQFMNSTAAQRLGGRPGDYVGQTVTDVFPPEFAARHLAFIRSVIESGKGANTVSLSYVRGEPRWYNTTVEPLRDSTGDITGALVIARDVHQLKQAQEGLDAYRERFARAEQLASVGTLSATLAHELTQPLTVIRLSIQNSVEDLQGISCPKRVLEDLHDGLAEIESVTAIAERFRNYARRTSDKSIKDVALKDIVKRIVVLLQENARRSRVALEIDGIDDLPEIPGYEKDLEQLVFALVQNAIQAADGQKETYCRITGARVGQCIELRVADNCGGIPPEHLPRVFEPFFTTKPVGEGTGLGLSIVQRVASQARGRVRVDSDYGQGSTFIVALPLKVD